MNCQLCAGCRLRFERDPIVRSCTYCWSTTVTNTIDFPIAYVSSISADCADAAVCSIDYAGTISYDTILQHLLRSRIMLHVCVYVCVCTVEVRYRRRCYEFWLTAEQLSSIVCAEYTSGFSNDCSEYPTLVVTCIPSTESLNWWNSRRYCLVVAERSKISKCNYHCALFICTINCFQQ